MKLYNTLSRQVEQVTPFVGNHVGVYACGPTVYDYTHIGHLRKYTMDDVLIRTLRHAHFEVKFVQNVTDVGHLSSDGDTGEDKLEKGAKKYNQTVWDIARQFEDYFFRSMDMMGNIRPDVSCRATDHIQRQLEMVLTLEKKGYTYIIPDDGVYFDTTKLADYGKLARLKVDELLEGARVEMVAGKRHAADFALWKFERPGENRAMVWESPWAQRSFPGWHIECSAMSVEHLGEQFEIHTGGIDHIPVHHTNEIAQSEAATGKKPFVKYWVHHNFLRVDGEKMSKSLGNFYTIDDILQHGATPQALRLLFLSTHYRSELNFTWDSLAGMQRSWQRLVELVAQTQALRTTEYNTDEEKQQQEQIAEEWRSRFFTAMETDLSTSEAMAVFWQVAKSNLSATYKYRVLLEFDQVLGLGLAKIEANSAEAIEASLTIPPSVQTLITQRQKARQEKDWQKSDQLRDQLLQMGYVITDLPDGTQQVKALG